MTVDITMDEQIVDLAYERICGAIPEGTSKGETLRAACRLVGDVLAQVSDHVDTKLLVATIGVIKCEYEIFLEKDK